MMKVLRLSDDSLKPRVNMGGVVIALIGLL